MRVPREWVWVVILVAVLTIALLGCAPATAPTTYLEDQQEAIIEYGFEMVYLHWSPVYLLKFEGHEYLTRGMDSNVLHTVSCPGVHDE